MHVLLQKSCRVFLFFLCDIFYFFITNSLVFHMTLCATLYVIFTSSSLLLLFQSFILLGCLSSLLFHSYTVYYISVLPWLVLFFMVKHYIGNKNLFFLITLLGILTTHLLLLYFSPFKPMVTPFYTFMVISCNIIGMYLALLKFPIVEQGNRL